MDRKLKGTYTLKRLFPYLCEEDLLFLQEHSSVIRLKKGQHLFVSGDTARAIYGVANGCLKIMRENQEGGSIITRIAKSGQMIGIREVFGEMKYERSGVALKESEVFSIEKTIILDLTQKNPQISLQFIKSFCSEINRIEKRIEAQLYRPAKNRVASIIYELYQLFCDEDAQSFVPPVNRRDIAELSDVTPETVSRALAELKHAGVLETRGASFHIFDPIALQNEAEER
jgi:CRP-like cAMP-binding protein